MTIHEWLSFITCIGLVELTIIILLRGNRNAMESPLLLLCIDNFGWNFAAMSFEITGIPAWHWLDVTISPLAIPLTLHVIVAYVGRTRALRWALVSAYTGLGALSFASAMAFFVPAMSAWTFSDQWSELCLAGYVPCLVLALVLLLLHFRTTGDALERSATRLTLISVTCGGLLTATELLDDLGVQVPNLGNLGTLLSTGLMTIAAFRLGMVEQRMSFGLVAYTCTLAILGVGSYLVLLRSFHTEITVLSLGFCTVSLAIYSATRDAMTSLHATRQREERFAELGRIADQMAHDIRNPLAALKGALEFEGEERRRSSGNPSRFHALMLDQVQRLDRVVGTYQQVGRITPVLCLMQVNDLISDLVSLESRNHEGIQVSSTLDPDLPLCSADRDLLARAIENLTKNAVEAMGERGSLMLRTERRTTLLGRAWVRITVQDTGPGIDARELNRLFGAFYTTKSTGGGLGLTYVQRVMQAHRGRVVLNSQPNRGTTVHLELRAT